MPFSIAWASRGRVTRVLAWAAVILAYLTLGVGYLWPHELREECDWRTTVAWVGFLARSLQFQIGLGLTFIALAAAFSRGKRLFLLAAPLVVLALGPWFLRLLPSNAPPAPAGPWLRVITCNAFSANAEGEKLAALALAHRADVLVIQEYTPWFAQRLEGALGKDYPHRVARPRGDAGGMAVLSRLPLVGAADFDVSRRGGGADRPQVRVVLDAGGGRRVALYNCHPHSPRTPAHYRMHGHAVADVRDAALRETLPTVLAGDFNMTESNWEHHMLRGAGFADAFDHAGRRGPARGTTWPKRSVARFIPGIRIDHVYTRGGLVPVRCEVLPPPHSDHAPLLVELAFER